MSLNNYLEEKGLVKIDANNEVMENVKAIV